MATKEYFVKVSWQDPAQPLSRIHDNGIIDIDLSKDVYEIVDQARKAHCGYASDASWDFIIDFMIPTGRED